MYFPQMLFEKIRQEQLRKWRIREDELLMKERAMPAKPPKKPKVCMGLTQQLI